MSERKHKTKKEKISYDRGFRLYDGVYHSFSVYNPATKKNERITLTRATSIYEEAIEERHQYEIRLGIAQQRAQRRFEFLNEFHDQQKLFDLFKEYRQKVAKNSWKDEYSRIRQHVIPFFYSKLKLNHPALWFEYWQGFHEYLRTKEPIRNNTKGQKLSVNSCDNIIRAANAFISFVESQESGSPLKRLPEFKLEEKGIRGAEAVYQREEISAVIAEFEKKNERKYALLFGLLANTGMRVSEGLGLMKNDVVLGAIPNQERWIFTALKDKAIFYGYILLKSQPLDENNLIVDGQVKRKPLKKRKKINPEYNRVIPIIDEDIAKNLLELKNNVSNFELLFEGCSYRRFYFLFCEIKNNIKLKKCRDIHSLRHTFATRFAALCDGDPRIVEKVIGHSDPKMTARYNHLAAELESNEMAKSEIIRPIKLA